MNQGSKLFFLMMCFMSVISGCVKNEDVDTVKPVGHTARAAKINAQLGMTYLEQGQVNRAKQKLLLALQLQPNIPEPWYAMAYFLESTGNNEEANQDYLKAIALNPERGDSLNNYGTFLCRHDQYELAVTYFEKAAKNRTYLEPAAAYENAGLCALKNHDDEKALAFFSHALKEDNMRPVSLLSSAEIYYDLGDEENAKITLSKFLQLSKSNSRVQALQKKLENS